MLRTLFSLSSLLLGIGVLLMGLALLSTAMGVRAVAEGFNDAVTGVVMASYFMGFVAGSYLCPRLIRRIGPIRSYAALAAACAVAAFLVTLLVHPLVWGILRFVIGTAMIGLYMVLESWLNATTPNEVRGRVFAIYMIVTLLAFALGQYLLLFDPGAQTIAFGIAALFFSLGLIPVTLTRMPEPKPVPVVALRLRNLIQLSPLSVVGALIGGMATSSFWALGAVFAERIGLTGTTVVQFMAITIVGGVVLQWPIGRLSDYIDRRIVLTLVAILAATAAILGTFVYAHSLIGLYIVMFVLGGLMFSIYSLSVAYLNDRVQADDALDASRGVLLTYGFGAIFGPILAGLTMTLLGPGGLFYYLVIVLCSFALFAILRTLVSEAVPATERSSYLPVNRTSQAVLELDPRLDTTLDTLKNNTEKSV